MANFMGGSAWKMAQDITEGFVTLNPSNLKRYSMEELKVLAFELGKNERTVRGEQVSLDDLDAIKTKNRRIQRISQALMIMRNFAQQRFKTRL